MITRVGHWKRDAVDCDVYVGRGSAWGNPYVPIGWAKKSKHDVIEVEDPLGAYEAHVRANLDLMLELHTLRGKVLGCWCVRLGESAEPERCHGHVLARMADELADPTVRATTAEEAIARMRLRWTHPPIDVRDIEERVAIRMATTNRETRVLRTRNAARVFVATGGRTSKGRTLWCSRYVHGPAEVDGAIDWILAQIDGGAVAESEAA